MRRYTGVTPTRLRFRCHAPGLDRPALVTRRDRRPADGPPFAAQPELQLRWEVDHQRCLQAWRAGGHTGTPDAEFWDSARQFIEEALSCCGDGPAAGPAPLSLATLGGWYDGLWRASEFQQLMARPQAIDPAEIPAPWLPFEPARRWRRMDATPADRPDPSRYGYAVSREPPVFFRKTSTDQPVASLAASVFSISSGRDDERRRDFVDYRDGTDHCRLGGTRTRLATTRVARLGLGAAAPDPSQPVPPTPRSDLSTPGLDLWRRLRDAGEGGLRAGETMRVEGSYVLDRFFPPMIRVTAMAVTLPDFDYRLSGNGNDFEIQPASTRLTTLGSASNVEGG